MIGEALKSVRIEFLHFEAPAHPRPPGRHCVEFSDAAAAARREREMKRERERERESEKAKLRGILLRS